MNSVDSQSCLDHVALLWKKWDADVVETEEWLRQLGRLRCTALRFKAAASQTKLSSTGRFHTPVLPDILTTLRGLPGGKSDASDAENPVVQTGWWVVRKGTMDARPLLLTPKDSTHDDHCRRLCFAMLQGGKDDAGLEELYPGEWTIVGPGCNSAFEALRVGNPDWEARYQAAWAKGQERMASDVPARQSADEFFARAAK